MSDRIQQIDGLRAAGRWVDALQAIQAAKERGNADLGSLPSRNRCPEFYAYIFGSHCLLLEAARGARTQPDAVLAAIRKIFQPGTLELLLQKCIPGEFMSGPHIQGVVALLNCRRRLIEVALDKNLDYEQIVERIDKAICGYTAAWNYETIPAVATAIEGRIAASFTPAFLREEPASGAFALPKNMRDAFQELLATYGPLHPGLLLAGDTLAYLLGNDDRRKPDFQVETWILLVDKQNDVGLKAKLCLERVPNGCGAIYPDPLAGGYRRTDKVFQNGLQHAWLAAMKHISPDRQFDVRWSVRIEDEGDTRPVDAMLSGASAEVAIYCGLKALAQGEPLDDQAAVTAQFRDPGNLDFALAPVNSVRIKANVADLCEIIVGDQQRVAYLDREYGKTQGAMTKLKIGEREVELVYVRSRDEAYERLSRYGRITQIMKGRIAAAARLNLKKECEGPYVLSSLARELLPEKGQQRRKPEPSSGPLRRPTKSLPKRNVLRIVRGQLSPGKRIRIIADSGLGKTSLLIYCEMKIAKSAGKRVPLRLSNLSAFPWTKSADVIREIAQELEYLTTQSDGIRGHLTQWVEQLINRGDAVFLLDALDQTTTVNGMSPLLDAKKGKLKLCSVLVTGRESVLNGHGAEAWGKYTRWTTYQVEPFDRARQVRYLGDELARKLIYDDELARKLLINDELSKLAEEYRKQQWAPLLGIPLLLKLLKQLAVSGDFERLQNRHGLYAEAYKNLYWKGEESLREKEQADDLLDAETVEEELAQVAWQMVDREENFTGQITGTAFRRLLSDLTAITIHRLKEINLLTAQSVLEPTNKTLLAWRHLSFCEYFAGVHLAGLPADEQTRVAQAHARDDQWNWVFRFALSRAEAESRQHEADSSADLKTACRFAASLWHLATELIRYGNPFVVYEAIHQDQLDLQEDDRLRDGDFKGVQDLDTLCRWLVHRRWDWQGTDYRSAWDESAKECPALQDSWLDVLDNLFSLKYRHSKCLHSAWELLETSTHLRARKILDHFKSEFPAILRDPRHAGYQTAQRLVRLVEGSALNDDPWGFARCPANPAEDSHPFPMGSPEHKGDDNEENRPWDDEYPQHDVVVNPFWMQRTPVTYAQFALMVPADRRLQAEITIGDPNNAHRPADYVNWYEASMFCRWLGPEYRLPTEAQWEYACRAMQAGAAATKWCFGDDEELLEDYAWYDKNSEGHSHPVGKKKPNAWGLYDMHGNVWEWCADGYGAYPENRAADPEVDPAEPPSGSYRLYRGGGWFDSPWLCRAADRSWGAPSLGDRCLGFRLARSPSSGSSSE